MYITHVQNIFFFVIKISIITYAASTNRKHAT